MSTRFPGITDAHTHILAPSALVNRFPFDPMPEGYFYSVGIHPWHAADATPEQWQWLQEAAQRPDVLAIGECGLDKLCATPWPAQLSAFKRQIALSEQVGKPLVIHDVRAHQEIIALHRELRPSQPWIIHGFRGKPELARQFLGQGFYISIGEKYNPATLAVIPASRLLRETDTLS